MAELTAKQLETLERIAPEKQEFFRNLWLKAAEWREQQAAEERANADSQPSAAQPDGDGGARPRRRAPRRHPAKRGQGICPSRQGAGAEGPAAARQEEVVTAIEAALALPIPPLPIVDVFRPLLCPRHQTPLRETHLWKGGWACDACLDEHRQREMPRDRSVARNFFHAAAEGVGSALMMSPDLLTANLPLSQSNAAILRRFMTAYEAWRRSL